MIFREWELTPPSMNTVKTTFIHKSELNVNATPQVIISLSAKGKKLFFFKSGFSLKSNINTLKISHIKNTGFLTHNSALCTIKMNIIGQFFQMIPVFFLLIFQFFPRISRSEYLSTMTSLFLQASDFVSQTPPRRFEVSTQTILEDRNKGWGYCLAGVSKGSANGKCPKKKSYFNVKNNRL